MATILRFGSGGGGGGASCPYPHVWECTAVKSGSYMVISGVSQLEPYDIIHFVCPVGQSATSIMINGVSYAVGFTVEGEMYIQYDGNDFVEVASSGACTLPHVWTSPVYTITGTDLEITSGVDDLRTNDVIVLTLGSGESATTITYSGVTYGINGTIDDTNTYYVQFNGLAFDIGLFTFLGDATIADVVSGKTFYSNSGALLTGNASIGGVPQYDAVETKSYTGTATTVTLTFTQVDLSKCAIVIDVGKRGIHLNNVSISGTNLVLTLLQYGGYTDVDITATAYEYDNAISITRTLINHGNQQQIITTLNSDQYAFTSLTTNLVGGQMYANAQNTPYDVTVRRSQSTYDAWSCYINILEV